MCLLGSSCKIINHIYDLKTSHVIIILYKYKVSKQYFKDT